MKVVFVFAGILKFKGRLLKQIRTLQEAGHECVLVHGQVEDTPPDYTAYPFEVRPIRLCRHKNKLINFCRHMEFNRIAARALDELAPGAVVCVELYGALSGALARARNPGLRFIFDSNELFMHMGMRPLKKLMWGPLHAWVFGRADVVTHAEEQRLIFCRQHYRSHARHILLENLPHGGISTLPPRPAPQYPLRVVYVGALLPDRCCEEVIRAFGEIPPEVAVCDFIGFGAPDYEARLRDLIARQGKAHIRILPPVPHAQMQKTLLEYDVGLAFYENLNLNQYYCAPNKIYDYIASGLPTISNNYPGLVQVLERNGIGVCVEEVTAASMTAALNRVVQERMADRITADIRSRYSWGHQVQRYRAIFE